MQHPWRAFKNERGVKIHQGKSKCKEQSQQRKAPELTQSNLFKFKGVHQSVEEVQGQEANHSAPDLPAEPTQSIGRVGEPESLNDFERKPRLNLPPAADRRWAQLDNDLNTILENNLKGDAAKKIKIMVEVVYQACHDTFDKKEGVRPGSIDPMTAVVQRVKASLRITVFPFSRNNKIKWNTFSYIFYLVISSDSINEKVLMISVHH